MYSRDNAGRRGFKKFAARLAGFGLAIWMAGAQALAAETAAGTEVWLVTYGPGEIYWQRFGHNAIWIRDPGLGLDHVFNFGFFDFEQKGFLKNFIQGRMMYFSAAQPAQREFAQYIDEDRSIRAQRLNLTAQQALSLTEYLVNEIQLENRDYLYDYYWNNCSTRVRDALDLALGHSIRDSFEPLEAEQDLRDHTRRLTIADFWLYLGLELALGSPVDQPISHWDEFFIPAILADGLSQMTGGNETGRDALVEEDVMLYQSSRKGPPQSVAQWWPRYLVFGVALLALAAVLCRLVRRLDPLRFTCLWLSVAGCLGICLLYLWFFTDHDVARNNLNLALFNPLWLLGCAGRRFYNFTAFLLLGLGVLSVLMLPMPPNQYTADVLAAFLPLNVASAGVLIAAARKSGEPSVSKLG